MILMMGPPGAGKSLQGQILAARYGWDWVSVGKLLRERNDDNLTEQMKGGNLLPVDVTNRITMDYLDQKENLDGVILDGYPRMLEQAQALNEYLHQRTGHHGIDRIIVLEIGRDEIMQRLLARGRVDDNEAAITHRIETYADLGEHLLDYYRGLGVRIDRIIASRTVGQVHDDIVELLQK